MQKRGLVVRPLPVFLIVLDGLGTLLFVVGLLGFSGIDFGYPVLQTSAWVFLTFGVALMAPLIVWVVRKSRSR
jgi:hypothetical protein